MNYSPAFRAARLRASQAEHLHALFNNGMTRANLEVQQWAFEIAKEAENA